MPSLLHLARGVLPAVAVTAALVAVVPGLEAPFSTPKRWVLLVAAALALALLPWSRRRLAWPPALLPATALVTLPFALGSAPAPTWTWLSFGALAFAWASSGVDARWLVPSVVVSGALVAVVALVQAAGVDPFAAFVPHADGERLRVYATLGNPDFVASALTVVLCLAVAWTVEATRRGPWLLGVALVLLGLAVTRSFATVASLGAALVLGAVHLFRPAAATSRDRTAPGGDAEAMRFAALSDRSRARWLVLAAPGLVAVLLLPLAGRSLADAAEGRLYLARVIAPHALDAPLAGLGPGATEALWPVWEVEWWRARCGDDAACVAADPRFRFAALQDHAHDDSLEVLVERGLPGLAALVVLFAFALRRAWRSRRPLGTGVVAALVAVMTRAALDFPLARPADLCLLAAVVGLASSLEEP